MLEEAKIVSFDVGLRVYTRTRTKERERERERFRERKIQRETARKREEEERLVFRSGPCKRRSGNFRLEEKYGKNKDDFLNSLFTYICVLAAERRSLETSNSLDDE
jgi:hypothetical protein|tara:strand:+ start:1059 stop:1376 length:318 start_codon:yes stop_codon:yes gene_type:complete